MVENGSVRRYSDRREIVAIILLAVFSFLAVHTEMRAQVAAYASTSYGYDQNPLSNYQKSSDQLQQNHLDLNYVKEYDLSAFVVGYTGGLVFFNHFQERNYLEHSATGRYSHRYLRNSGKEFLPIASAEKKETSASQAVREDLTDNENTAESDSAPEEDSTRSEMPTITEIDSSSASMDEIPADNDSTDMYLDLGLAASARHDKGLYNEFDNVGADASTSYRFIASDTYFLRLTNSLGFRSYVNIIELSNVTDIVTVEYALRDQKSARYGFLLSGGAKYYTQNQYDTTKFETKRTTTVIQKPAGKGKPGGTVLEQSTKGILIQPQSNYTTQIVFGVYTKREWTETGLEFRILYRYNPTSNSRYLAQRSIASTLTNDLYNDFFSYQGFEFELRLTQNFPLALHAELSADLQEKKFNVPALTIAGDETGAKRKDARSIIEAVVSRVFELSEGLSVDISLSIDALRNKSNDEYNDFSGNSVSLAVGIGF